MSEPEITPVPEQTPVNDGRPWLAIFVNADETIKVTGHIQDKIIAYGILGAARDAIMRSIDKTSKTSQIERVNGSGGLINFLRNGRH